MSEIYLNVRDFGAVGDGVTDDTAAFQAALAQAAADCGTVFVPMGRYSIRPITLPSHVTLRGNASWGYSGFGYENNKVFQDRPTDPEINGNTVLIPHTADGLSLLNLTGCVGTRIIGLSFDGLYRGQRFHCIYAAGGAERQDLVFEDVRICHFSGTGIRLAGVHGFALRRSLIIKNQSHALDCAGSKDGSIMDNQLAYNLGAGLYACHENEDGTVTGTSGLLVTANRIEGGYPGGVYLCNSRLCTITGNSFDGCRGAAITLIQCASCTLTGNMSRIHGMTRERDENCHYRIDGGTSLTISGNTFWCWYALILRSEATSTGPFFGMILKDLDHCIVTGNAMHECCSEELIHSLGGHTDTEISGNTGSVYALPSKK